MHIIHEDLLGGDAMKFRRAFRPAAGLAWVIAFVPALCLVLCLLAPRPAEAVLWAPVEGLGTLTTNGCEGPQLSRSGSGTVARDRRYPTLQGTALAGGDVWRLYEGAPPGF
jgi:hypothetical protein